MSDIDDPTVDDTARQGDMTDGKATASDAASGADTETTDMATPDTATPNAAASDTDDSAIESSGTDTDTAESDSASEVNDSDKEGSDSSTDASAESADLSGDTAAGEADTESSDQSDDSSDTTDDTTTSDATDGTTVNALDEFAESVNFSVIFDDDDEDNADADSTQADEDDDILLVEDALTLDDAVITDDSDFSDADSEGSEQFETGNEIAAETTVDGSETAAETAPEESADSTDFDESAGAEPSNMGDGSDSGKSSSGKSSSNPSEETGSETDNADAGAASVSTQSASSGEVASKETASSEKPDKEAAADDANPHADTAVVDSNAAHVNETLSLATTAETSSTQSGDHNDVLDAARFAAEHTARASRRETASTVSSRLDRELNSKEEQILLKSNPTFGFDSVSYHNNKSGRDVIDDLSLAFQAGNVYAVLIPDDDDELRATLVGLMSGLLYPTKGNVMNKSTNYLQLEQSELRGHRIGLITQTYAVRDDMTPVDNIVYTMDASGRTFLKPKKVLAKELLASTGVDEALYNTRVGELSDADQRRVAIARAICCEASIIVADEPTGGLNDTERDSILALLHSIATGDPKRCVIIVTTDDAVADNADRVVEL